MKKFILWLAKVCKVDLIREVVKVETKIERIYLPTEGKLTGNLTIEGDVKVLGSLYVEGGLYATSYITAKEEVGKIVGNWTKSFDGVADLTAQATSEKALETAIKPKSKRVKKNGK